MSVATYHDVPLFSPEVPARAGRGQQAVPVRTRLRPMGLRAGSGSVHPFSSPGPEPSCSTWENWSHTAPEGLRRRC